MDTEYDQIGDEYDEDLEDIIERQGDENEAEEDEDDDRRGGDDEAIEAPAPKKKDETKDEIKKKREPRPKLDSVRLAGPRGLLALEAETKNLKLRGKGHELEDLEVVLGHLQHWAHRLFPSYTFDDCLDKLEKLGSKKNIGVQIKKIRLGLTSVDDIHDTTVRGEDYAPDEEDIPVPRLRDLDAEFDNVRNTARPVNPAPVPTQQIVPTTVLGTGDGLTEEQKERMRRNRMAAEERRLARLREQREQELRAQEEAAALEAMAEG